jgi:outer membrane lipoprotein SlyB
MSATFESSKPASAVNKPLWAAVGVLGIAVLAMGATLIRIQTRPEEPRLAVLAATAPALAADNSQDSASKKAAAPVNHAPAATHYVASKGGKTGGASAAAVSPPGVHMAKPICASCGTVESVTPIQRDGTAGGVGAVAGGVLGAVVGNQVGDGNGKTLATILGAVGGGYAGNTVEKKMKKETVYQVQVHMEDGSTRTMEQSTPATVGAKVMVEGSTLQPASR